MRMGLLKVCYKNPDWDLAQAISTASERILGRARSSARTPWWNPTIKAQLLEEWRAVRGTDRGDSVSIQEHLQASEDRGSQGQRKSWRELVNSVLSSGCGRLRTA